MATALSKIRTVLDSFSPNYLPILTESQMTRSIRMSEQLMRDRGRDIQQNRPAAVFVPLCTVDTVPSILFTLRHSDLRSHAGQVSFPGGHADCDEIGNPEATALRETREELLGHDYNVDSPNDVMYDFDSGIEVLGRTGRVPALTGNMVTPIIGALTYDLPRERISTIFPGNEGEVDQVFAMSVKELIEVETSEELKRLGAMGPVYPAGGDRGKVWGLTAIILRPILHKILKPAGFV